MMLMMMTNPAELIARQVNCVLSRATCKMVDMFVVGDDDAVVVVACDGDVVGVAGVVAAVADG